MKLDALQKLANSVPNFKSAQAQEILQQQLKNMGLNPTMLYQELEMASPYVDTHRDQSYSNAHMQLHSHTFYEMLCCCNSCGAEYLVGSERYRLQEGDIIFIPPGISHRPLLPANMTEPYIRYVVWMSTDFMQWYGSLYPRPFAEKQSNINMLHTSGVQWEHLRNLFRFGVQEAEQKLDGWESAVIGNTMMLLTAIKRAADELLASQIKAEKPELLDRLTAYVETHYHKPISAEKLGREFFVSSSTVSHLFKQKLGVSFYCYVTQRRLIAAKSLIGKGILLENVAVQTGFSDYSGFFRAFKREYGISPRQYRTLQETGDKNPPPKQSTGIPSKSTDS